MSISAPDYAEAPGVEQARLNFNRSALNATAWLRRRTGGTASSSISTSFPAWLGGSGSGIGSGGSIPASVNNALAAAGVPSYQQQAPVDQEALAAAQAQFDAMQGSDSIFSKINRAFHTTSNLALQTMDFPLEVVRNLAVATMRDAKAFSDDPSVTGFLNAMAPDPAEAVADTTVNAFINTVQEHGLDYALGPDGLGTGYTLDPESAVALEKESLAKHLYTLENGDAATIGRFLLNMVGADRDSTVYKVTSGVIDAATLAMDPLNAIAPQAKVASAAKGVAVRGAAGDALSVAGDAVAHLPGTMKDPAVRAAFDADAQTVRVMRDLAEKNPDLASAVASARAASLGSLTQDRMARAAMASGISDAGLRQNHLIEAHNYVLFQADTAAEALMRSNDRINDIGVQIRLHDEAIDDLSARARDLQKQGDDAGAAAAEAQRAGYIASKEELEGQRAAQEAVEAQFISARQELFKTVEGRQALQEAFDVELARHADLDEADRAAAAAVHQSGNELIGSVYDTLGTVPPKDLRDIRTGLQAVFGLTDEGVNMRTAMAGLTGGNADVAAQAMVAIDDFATMRDVFHRFDAETLQMMTRVADADEAKLVLAGYALDGHVGDFNTRAALYLANRGERIGSQGSAARRAEARFQNAVRRSRPDPVRTHVANKTDVVDLVDNQISAVAVLAHRSRRGDSADWWEFRKEWINKVGAAETWVEHKNLVIELQDELIERIPGWDDMTREMQDDIRQHLGRLRQGDRLADERAVVARALMTEGGKESALFGKAHSPTEPSRVTKRLIRSGADLSQELTILDPDALRTLQRAIGEAAGLRKAGKWTAANAIALNDVFDQTLRPLYLAFRPGYMTLQLADGSMRSLLYGATSLPSHPLTTLAVASSMVTRDRPRLFALAEKLIGSSPVGADGMPLLGEAQRQWWQMGLQRTDQLETARQLRSTHFRDLNEGRLTRTIPLGMKKLAPGDDGFHTGWAEDALRVFAPGQDPIFESVLGVLADGALPKNIDDWAVGRWGDDAASLDPRQVVTEFFHSGPGRAHLADLAAANRKAEGIGHMNWIYSDRERLHTYLWDADEAYSFHNLAHEYTGNLQPEAVALLRDVASGQAQFEAHLSRLTPRKARQARDAAFTRDVRVGDDVVPVNFAEPVDAWTGQQLRKLGVQEPLAVQVRDKAQVPAEKGARARLDQAMDSFFGAAGRLEKAATHAPFMLDEITLQTVKRISSLTPEDAAVVAERLRKNNIPKGPKSAKMRQADQLLDRAVAQANGQGAFTIEHITAAADRAAVNTLKDTMYGLRGRNMEAQRMSLLLPFVQAAANGYKVYTRGVAENPVRAVNAMRAWENAHTEDSGVIYDVVPGVHRDDPTQPLVWTDTYGEQKISVPFLGYAMHGVDSALGLLPFYEPNPSHTDSMDVNVGKWNPVNFGEPLPGVGMGVTVPAAMVKGAFGQAALPSWLEEYIYPFQSSDVDQDQGFLYSNAPWFIKTLFPSPQQQVMSMGTAMSALMATDPYKYADPATGYINQEGASLLTRDAADLAKSLAAMGQVRAAVFRGGVSQPKTITDVETGRAIAVSIVWDEFERVKEESTSGQAFSHILDKYGTAGVAYLIGKRESAAHATDAGYEFARANTDVLDAAPDMLGYFFPASELKYRSPEYDRLLSELDRGHAKTPEEYAQDVNRVIWNARKGRLDELLAAGTITSSQYKAEKALLSDEYGVAVQGEFNTKRYETNHLQLRQALENQELAAGLVGQSLAIFYQTYDAIRPTLDGQTFSGKKDRAQREAMVQTGEALARANPAFAPLWDSELKWEFREDPNG